MILAAGLTPAWQQILSFDHFTPGEVNRANQVEWCASGKVLNVGMALHYLGADVQTLCVIGGRSGEAIQQEFATRNIPARWIASQTPTRICTTILDQRTRQTTELVENSAALIPEEVAQFRKAFQEEARTAEWVVLSGSLPAGISSSFYRELMQDCPGRVILDVRGPELEAALEQNPFLIKPNRAELASTVKRELATETDTFDAMRELNRRGAEWVVITNGPDSVLASHESGSYRLVPPKVSVVNPIACGDCFAAGLAWGFHENRSPDAVLRLGVAAATENATQLLPARLNPDEVLKISQTIRVDVVSS